MLAITVGVTALALAVSAHARDKNDRVVGYGQISFRGHGPEYWYNRAAARYDQVTALRNKLGDTTRTLRRTKRITLTSPDAHTAIKIASLVYHIDYTMLDRKASCETGGTYDEHARNNASSDSPMGLFQFKPSTFRSTPFGEFDIYNAYINSLAAGWMHANGRGGEWACQ